MSTYIYIFGHCLWSMILEMVKIDRFVDKHTRYKNKVRDVVVDEERKVSKTRTG